MRRAMMVTMAAVAALTIGACDYETERDMGGLAGNEELADDERLAADDDLDARENEEMAAAQRQQPGQPAQRQQPGQQPGQPAQPGAMGDPGGTERTGTAAGAGSDAENAQTASDARDLVQGAATVVDRMQRDPELAKLLQQAEGVFIVPKYGKGAAIIGARGGEGVLVARGQNGTTDDWTGPLFHDIGAISVGPQIGAAGGDIAMLLMNEEAVQSFTDDDNFSLNADAGFTLVDYSAEGQASAGKGDVILWSDMEGAFAGVALSVTDISVNEDENEAYYDRQTTPEQILSGQVQSQHADALLQKLKGSGQATG